MPRHIGHPHQLPLACPHSAVPPVKARMRWAVGSAEEMGEQVDTIERPARLDTSHSRHRRHQVERDDWVREGRACSQDRGPLQRHWHAYLSLENTHPLDAMRALAAHC